MNKTITDINGCTKEIEFKFNNEDLQPKFDKAYKAAQPHIDMKGFRKGKVPVNIIKKYYGKKIEIEAIE